MHLFHKLVVCAVASLRGVDAVRRSVSIRVNSSGSSPVEDYIKEGTGYCPSLHWKSTCKPDEYRGVAIYFHGFGGCADQGDEIGPKLATVCWDVFAPVNPGHSKAGKLRPCDKYVCTTQIDDFNGFDMSDYPSTTGWEYKQFSHDMTLLAEKERKYRNAELGLPPTTGGLAAMGLSLGSAIAFRATMDHPHLFKRVLIANPFFGAGQEDEDYDIRACNDAVLAGTKKNAECAKQTRAALTDKFGGGYLVRSIYRGGSAGTVRKRDMRVLRDMAKVLPRSTSDAYLSKVTRWDAKCQKVHALGATGTCVIMQKHLIAVHTFAYQALEAALSSGSWFAEGKPPVVQIMLTEADGITRNGLSYSAAKRLHCADPKQHIHVCMHPFQKSSENVKPTEGAWWDSENVVPHAMIGKREHWPDQGWWDEEATKKFLAFFSGEKDDIGDHVEWAPRDKTKCVALPLTDKSVEIPWVRHIVLPEADGSWDDVCLPVSTTTTTTTKDPYSDYEH